MEELKKYKDYQSSLITRSKPKESTGLEFRDANGFYKGSVMYGSMLKAMWMQTKFIYYKNWKWNQ